MHAVIFGGSRGCGYYAAYYLLSAASSQWSVTLLLRDTQPITSDARLAPYIAQGRLDLVQGDATVEHDVRGVLTRRKVDYIVSSIGKLQPTPALTAGAQPTVSLRGFVLQGRPDLCAHAMHTLVRVLASLNEPRPRVLGVSSMGIGDSHDCMPWLHRWTYPTLIHAPHQDKQGMEDVLLRAARRLPSPESTPPEIIPPDVFATLPENILDEIVIVRPAALLGGDAMPGVDAVRAGEQLTTWSVKRSEVGRFIAEECAPGNDEWVNKKPVVGY